MQQKPTKNYSHLTSSMSMGFNTTIPHGLPTFGRTSTAKWLFILSLLASPNFAPSAFAADSEAGTAAQARQSVIKGVVVDQNGEPVPGANVIIVGTTKGTITDFDGNFSISVEPGQKLKFSFLGFEDQELPAADGMKVVLVDQSEQLGEIQVVAYGAQKKVTVTGAISSVDGAELSKTPVGSVSNMLTGQLAGLTTVQSSGQPGADAAEIFVRGKATWVDASPLVQVDGVERDFNDIDPNEIESITILKDASATAVFGVRGANGVVLVTTKRGAEGKAKISATTSYSMLMPTKLIERANSYEYATFYNKLVTMDHEYDEPGAEGGWIDENGNLNTANLPFAPEVIEKFKNHSDPLRFPDTDWVDYCFKKRTLQTQHNLNISGGNKQVRYFVSAGFYTQDGLFKTFDLPYDCSYQYKRFNYRANLDLDVTPTTTLAVGVGGNHNTNWRPYSGQAAGTMVQGLYGATPFSSPGFVDGKLVNAASDYTDCTNLPFVGGNGIQQYYGVGFMSDTNNTLNMDLELRQKLDFLTKGLTFRVKGSYNSGFTSYIRATYGIPTYTPWLADDGSMTYRKYGSNGQLSYTNVTPSKSRNWYMETAINYDRTFADVHHVTLLALYNQSKTYYPKTYPEIPQGYVGLVGRLTYDYASRYMAEFNIGYNGSENFAEDKRFGVFPAVSVGWNISQEGFWDNLKDIVSYFKLRYTVGQVGNDKIGGSRFMYTPDPYKTASGTDASVNRGGYEPTFGSLTNFPSSSLATYESSKNNQDVTWEVSTKQNFGVDLNFIEDKLKFTFDYYVDKRRDILLQDGTAPAVFGFTTPYANFGKVDSWGWEVTAKWNSRLNDDWLVNFGVNLMFNDNEIIDKREAPQNWEYLYEKGYRIGSRNQLEFFELYEPGKTEERYRAAYGQEMPTQLAATIMPGDCVYVDQNGDGEINANDFTHALGKTDDPRYMCGINAGFTWKNLSFSMLWAGAWEVSRGIGGSFQTPFWAKDGSNQGGLLKYHYDNSWTTDNPDYNAKYPRPTFQRAANNYAGSDFWEQDSKYLRLKNVQITYNFNFPWMETIKMNTLQLALSGYNLVTFTPYIWGDPEAKASTEPSYPLNRTFTAALKLGF